MSKIDRLNKIIEETIDVIEKSRGEIIDIAENARSECRIIEDELNKIKEQVAKIIDQVDEAERLEKDGRYRLMLVSKNIRDYMEDDIKRAYEKARDLQFGLMMKKAEEQQLITRRNELERRLKVVKDTCFKAESLVSKVGVAMGYLSGGLQDLSGQLEDIKQKQLMGIRIIKAQEEERKRVAREIHDGPAQLMANLVIKTELCEKLVDIDTEKAKEELGNLKQVVRSSLGDVRKIIYDLRPMSLDDLGLVPTLQRFASNYMEETNINIVFHVFGDIVVLKSFIELAIFRIMQEGLNNIKKHSLAKNVDIKIEFTKEFINLIIRDDGIGFDKDAVKVEDVEGGYGLLSMRERAELLNGKLEIKSSKGNGTKIYASIPLQISEEG